MVVRWISLIVVCFTLSSCVGPRFDGAVRQFSGVWLYEFEGSTFLEGATGIPAHRPAYETTDWLDWPADQPRLEEVLEEGREDADCHLVQPILVTFVGQRTNYPLGGAGHMGLWRSAVTVHRTISAERLGPSFCYDG